MPDFSIAEFSYIATSDPHLKKGRTQRAKSKSGYAPYKDYYMVLRRAIQGLFKHQRNFSDLRDVAKNAHEKKRIITRKLLKVLFHGRQVKIFTIMTQ